jgi:ADP-ribosyl-[dinitrogen reductase] hydrolase
MGRGGPLVSTIDRRERWRGAMLGLAVGDAVGTTVEFRAPGSFEPITDMAGGGPFGLEAGQWTDDTSMALCLAESLIERGGFDARDQMQRYVRWYREGYNSSTGRCFDVGDTVRGALHRYERTGEPYAGDNSRSAAGNGSLMRLAPVPLRFAEEPELAIRLAAESSRMTHQARAAVDACRYFAGLLIGALQGADRDKMLSERFTPVPGLWEREPLSPEIDEIAAGSYWRRQPPEIRASGYVVHSLEAALWAFACSESFEDGCLAAVNLGEDADTTAAIYGQIAGAYYGEQGIPAPWRDRLWEADRISALADQLLSNS